MPHRERVPRRRGGWRYRAFERDKGGLVRTGPLRVTVPGGHDLSPRPWGSEPSSTFVQILDPLIWDVRPKLYLSPLLLPQDLVTLPLPGSALLFAAPQSRISRPFSNGILARLPSPLWPFCPLGEASHYPLISDPSPQGRACSKLHLSPPLEAQASLQVLKPQEGGEGWGFSL